jgi:hypothetical protein
MKLTPTVKQNIAAGIPGQYDYMDSLPMNGWAWEFVRRNRQYIETFIELEKLVKSGVWNDECDKRYSELSKVAIHAALIFSPKANGDSDNYLRVTPPHKSHPELIKKFLICNELFVPRPSKRFVDFNSSMIFFPKKKDYIIYESFNDLLNRETITTIDFETNTSTTKPKLDRSDEDAFYIYVYKKAKIVDVKEHLLTDIAKILEKNKPRVRQRK